MSKTALILGAGGFIGSHLARRLQGEGYWLRGVDLKRPEFSETACDEFVIGDLRDPALCAQVMDQDFDEIYQLAADMGGAGYIFTGENDADVMHNSATINLNVASIASRRKSGKLFYASSACIYPEYNQTDPDNPKCAEDTAYPAQPDSEYGWEKLFSERMYLAFRRNHDLDVRVARFHNVYGSENPWTGGREKAPAAICRKVAEAMSGEKVEIWGDGLQTRSFLHIDDALDALKLLMDGDFAGPVNIGSEEMVSINAYTEMVISVSKKELGIHHVEGPTGVRGRNSDNTLIEKKLGWKTQVSLQEGVERLYKWVASQVAERVGA